ncbi:hypothetical protein Lfu02_04830 [Longispora fulva]|uniref:ABC-type multidrug transport system fused ATPase/permease subunit n=1 Tax=Longispora fulva TaxID=619741 RepID=A0A8J7GCS1_9ACTN|nr:hypothetical protein [Longispora fulva]MBG6135650.1 ABC-type multidrug transport system fused ATPase/permease subunit [Longispora fulva]GIG56111.1 hypothetical protein Lfu02_04830 [Longispora fulva]
MARAFLADPAALVLDEATRHLDLDSESRVRDALHRLRHGRTTVLVAHRLSSVLDADQVAVVSGGRIAEVGPPEDLLRAGGLFATLHQRWVATST